MTEWKDVTSYSRDDKEKTPTTYESKFGDLRLVITCSHIHDRGNWRVICRPFFERFIDKRVEDYNVEQIQEIAVSMLREKIDRINEALEK